MSGAHPYCIVPAGHASDPELTGVDGRPVRTRTVGPVTVWYSCAPEPSPKNLERIRQHHAVVQSATAIVTPVPVRYGEWSPDEAALDESIRPRLERFQELLTALSGRVEYGVSVGGGGLARLASSEADQRDPSRGGPATNEMDGEPSAGDSGRRYLRALANDARSLRRALEERSVLMETLRARLVGIVVEERLTAGGRGDVASVAHLVRGEERERYVGLVRDWADEEAAGYEVRIMGPWPPYSFTQP